MLGLIFSSMSKHESMLKFFNVTKKKQAKMSLSDWVSTSENSSQSSDCSELSPEGQANHRRRFQKLVLKLPML